LKKTSRRWFSPGTPVSSTNKTDLQYTWNIVEIGVKQYNPERKTYTFVHGQDIMYKKSQY
jgi:hypothetical protein